MPMHGRMGRYGEVTGAPVYSPGVLLPEDGDYGRIRAHKNPRGY